MNIPKSQIEGIQISPTKPDHECWLKLGRETCNMDEWTLHCVGIVQWKCGKSHPVVTNLMSMYRHFIKIKGGLDDYLLASYRVGTKQDHEFSKAARITMTDVFYNTADIQRPDFPGLADDRFINERHKAVRYSHTLSPEECVYLLQYQSRLRQYVDCLKSVHRQLAKLSVMHCNAHYSFPQKIKTLDRKTTRLSEQILNLSAQY